MTFKDSNIVIFCGEITPYKIRQEIDSFHQLVESRPLHRLSKDDKQLVRNLEKQIEGKPVDEILKGEVEETFQIFLAAKELWYRKNTNEQ